MQKPESKRLTQQDALASNAGVAAFERMKSMASRPPLAVAASVNSLLALHAQERATTPDSAAKADVYIREEMAKRRIPGMSVAVIAADNGLFTKGYGFANVELSTLATSDTVYEIASLRLE